MHSIRKIQSRDLQSLADRFTHQDEAYFEDMYLEHLQETRQTFLAVSKNKNDELDYLAYVSLVWESGYTQFWRRNIPEITDLYVAEAQRKQGIATQLIAICERTAREKGYNKIGISVDQSPENKYLESVYEGLGYQADGFGVSQAEKRLHFVKVLAKL